MIKAWQHFKTISTHHRKVIGHCYKAGILWQGICHDLSKYTLVEFRSGAKYWSGEKSPNESEREEKGYSLAWMHHKGRNKHHFEYWTDYNPHTKQMEPVEMPLKYVKEMFCDRVAASKTYQKDNYTLSHPLAYFLKGKEARTKMIHPTTSDLLESWLRRLEQEGETATFAYIKGLKASNRE